MKNAFLYLICKKLQENLHVWSLYNFIEEDLRGSAPLLTTKNSSELFLFVNSF